MCSQSYHPTVDAYRAEADLLRPLLAVRPQAPNPPAAAPPTPAPPPLVPPAATGPSLRYRVQGTCRVGGCILLTRKGPGFSAHPIAGRLHEGDPVDIVCQDTGETVTQAGGPSSNVWDRLPDRTWVSDLYVTTPNVGTFSPPNPQCGSYDRTSVGGAPFRY